MAQHDFEIANQTFPSFRSDLNNALQSLAGLSSGASAPSTTFAYQLWYDTTADILKIRNADDDAWITLFTFDQAADSVQVSGEELVDDTSPQLGADLDTNGHNIDFGDNEKARFGDSQDFEIFHDGTDSVIKDKGQGNLVLTSNGGGIFFRNNEETETYANFNNNGSVQLRYDNSAKVETTANGITVTGTALATTDTDTTNTGSVTLDFAANQNFVLTLTGNVTLANPSTEQVGQSGFIVFIQDSTGGRTVSLGTDYETAGGAGLTLSSAASTTDIVPYVVAASGRILLGAPQLAFS